MQWSEQNTDSKNQFCNFLGKQTIRWNIFWVRKINGATVAVGAKSDQIIADDHNGDIILDIV
jgi:hypothetical protein